MRVEKQNKAFAYRIYSHFTQQCTPVISVSDRRKKEQNHYYTRVIFTFCPNVHLLFNAAVKATSIKDQTGNFNWSEKWLENA